MNRKQAESMATSEHILVQERTCEARTVGAIASGGSGSRISTLLAEERSLNCERALTRYSVRLRLCFSTMHSTQISGRTFWLRRYVLRDHDRPLGSTPARHYLHGTPRRSESCG